MKGGTKFYRGSATAARNYVECDRSRADDYYLAEGSGFAERYSATADGQVLAMPQMDGNAYEAWVSGVDPQTGEPRGRLRNDEHALRFTEVVVNGPKSWSIAAELHPDIAEAYGAAQTRAAEEIVAWTAQHATSRVGSRGGQYATPVEYIEAVAVQHHTSRAGDPHRHIHLQINARVYAGGQWRGIDSMAVRNSIKAVQGIGHATVMSDPAFREALAAHGFTLDAESGEVVELAGYVDAFSKRAGQISGQVEGYESEWRAANPDDEPGPALRRSWDARAWAEHRPGKAQVEPGQVLHERWLTELDALGYQPPTGPAPIGQQPVGQLDRDEAAAEILARLTAAGSAWNTADVRGEAEQLIARRGVIVDPGVRRELAEDLAARAAGSSRPLPGLEDSIASMPDHIRAWTSPEAIAVESDIVERLAGRGAADAVVGRDASTEQVDRAAAAAGLHLDPAQAEAAAALAGDHALVLVTGAAGAGKTTTLAATRVALEHDGHQLVVVTPTLKAARGARAETGAQAGTVAWLVHQHGWRQDDAGRWTRLEIGDADPAPHAAGRPYRGPREDAQLRAGDLVVVDEAGMLDQDTARGLLVVADEQHARVALVGDPHQLPAIGRGGVLDLAERWAERTCTLDVIHRFTRTDEIEPGITATVTDDAYAALSLRMRDGAAGQPAAVFDELAARGQVRIYSSEDQLRTSVATYAAEARRGGRTTAVSVATNEQADALNAAIRGQLAAAGDVDDGATGGNVATTRAGQRVGAGDLIVTRDNNRDLDVANRDTWTVLAVGEDGALTVAPTSGSGLDGERTLPAGYVNRHVQLGYAGTIHGVQGETADTAHLVLDFHTGAGAAYVGMTRGRTANDLHLVAEDLDDARAQWIDAAGRGRADLGLEAAREAVERETAKYAPSPAGAVDERARAGELARVLDQLRTVWTEQANTAARLEQIEPRWAEAHVAAERRDAREAVLAPLRDRAASTRAAAAAAAGPADTAREQLTTRAEAVSQSLRQNWDLDRGPAGEAARELQAGPGRFGRITGGREAVAANRDFLEQWATKWRPIVADLTDADTAADYARRHPGNDRIDAALHDYVARRVLDESPHLARDVDRGEETAHSASAAATAYTQALGLDRRDQATLYASTGWGARAEELTALDQQLGQLRNQARDLDQRLDQLAAEPAVTAQPDPAGWLNAAHQGWRTDRDTAELAAANRAAVLAARDADESLDRLRGMRTHEHDQPNYGHNADRDGPSLGR